MSKSIIYKFNKRVWVRVYYIRECVFIYTILSNIQSIPVFLYYEEKRKVQNSFLYS